MGIPDLPAHLISKIETNISFGYGAGYYTFSNNFVFCVIVENWRRILLDVLSTYVKLIQQSVYALA